MKENSYGKRLGRVWSQYSYIFVLLIIMIGYAYTVFINGNTFKFSHVAAIFGDMRYHGNGVGHKHGRGHPSNGGSVQVFV